MRCLGFLICGVSGSQIITVRQLKIRPIIIGANCCQKVTVDQTPAAVLAEKLH